MAARKGSSRRWLQRQRRDVYVRQAQAQGYPSRAAFKLLEIDARDRLLRPGMKVVDLGAAPGGWSQVAAERVGAAGKVVAVDRLPMEVPAGVLFYQGDFQEAATLDWIMTAFQETPADVVLSDMSPNLSGNRAVDQPRAMLLAELALDLCSKILKPGGDFLVKLFQGEGFDPFYRAVQREFSKLLIRKPEASRKNSREVYLLAKQRKL